MNATEIYSAAFVQKVTDTLNASCSDGSALTRTQLCHELGLTSPLPPAPTEPE
jgi:hypothetical protein